MPNNSELPRDNLLLISAKDGCDIAFGILFNKYKESIKLMTSQFYIQGSDDEDVFQEGLIGFYQAIKNYSFDQSLPFSVFASLCVKRQIFSAIRKASSLKHQLLTASLSNNHQAKLVATSEIAHNPLQKVLHEDYINQFFTSGKLSLFERKVVFLYLFGLSYKDISKRLNCQVKAVDNAIQRIKSKINKLH
ncbi:MAG: sigma-70 family RNA polymerase sigma factor [Actinobacteria bacterium]|nr:MAG: sigma-70 family RNA polymerase sigma factor [Actinomycetota bacterium]